MKLDLKDLPPLSPLAPILLELDWEEDDAEARLLRVVESDPALGARLLAAANSVGYAAPGVHYKTIVSAVRRIGLRRAIHLATSLLFAGSLSKGLPPALNRALWLHALALAYATQELARVKRLPEPNAAYFVGLVHDLGYMAMEYLQPGSLARIAAAAADAATDLEAAEAGVFGLAHHEVAAQLLDQWGVPADLVAPLRGHHAPDFNADPLAAILFGAEKLARSADVAAVLYAGPDHPFAALALDRAGIEALFAQRLELDGQAVEQLSRRIIDQVASLREAAAAMMP